jgi:hypothetical protein
MTELPIIDFAAHPAYAQLACPENLVDAKVDTLVNEIDGHFSRISATLYDHDQDCRREYEREISPRIDALIEAALHSPNLRPAFARHVKSAIESARSRLLVQLNARMQPRNSDMADITTQAADDLGLFRRDGFHTVAPNAALAKRVWAETFLERAVMRRMAKENQRRHCVISLDHMSAATKTLREFVERVGILDLVSRQANGVSMRGAGPRPPWAGLVQGMLRGGGPADVQDRLHAPRCRLRHH